ncbi:hypothetical protein BHU62_00835 [Serratia marcescens]|uniref:Uncharacterized protein n=1 Tax=Serratia marcescens TaxID=615 RepID=A0A1Q4P655_SERMA|nr:hypothetical protein BHU62_00835 [Serratia marcescens]
MPADATGNAVTVADAENDDIRLQAIALPSAKRRSEFPFLSNIPCPLYAHKKNVKKLLIVSVYKQKGRFALRASNNCLCD